MPINSSALEAHQTTLSTMALGKQPKALLFDIGGVCVGSPFQAILDYEAAHNIPSGWINFSISRPAPNGTWHRLERGEIKLDAHFFEGFSQDLRSKESWREFCDIRGKNQSPTHGVDATSAADSLPPPPDIDGEWLFWEMMRVASDPDPFMYPALKKLKASGQFLIAALSNTVIFPENHAYSKGIADEVRSQFDVFISSAHVGLRKPDPQIYLYAVEKMDGYVREKARVDGSLAKELGRDIGIATSDVIFLDDIGANLKTAKMVGMGTIKVQLGNVVDAVKELEKVTGLELLGEDDSKLRL
ncbi:hypothetical protein FGG08_000732 [Glutinoglossum americanum]|uniref:Epoxide hydrolase n=1 Tax=Glutinoglossum americanum TaxID=1670608 RepID=A0A9P8ICJ0_9PEZI|nr:hypothetical protein FGG08_000732 [Glutinoglossum americanum]